jgi:hypothetical protein
MPQGDRDKFRPTMVTDQARHELVHRGLLVRRSIDPRPGGRPTADHPYIKHVSAEMSLRYGNPQKLHQTGESTLVA